MALIVEDGTGITNANSYVTLTELTDYFSDRNVDASAILESDLIKASTFIDLTYGSFFKGGILNTEQSLLFPRTTFVDNNGRTMTAGVIPKDLKIATFHAALVSSKGFELITNPDPLSNVESYTKAVEGVVSKSEKFFSPVNRTETKFIGTYIRPLLKNGGLNNRTVRA